MRHLGWLALVAGSMACRDNIPVEPLRRTSPPHSTASLTGPSTANATVEWLGELAGSPGGVARSINASGAVVGMNGLSGPLGLSFRPGPVQVVWGVADPDITGGYYYDHTVDAVGINSSGLVTGLFLEFYGTQWHLYVSPVVGATYSPEVPPSRPTFLPDLPGAWGAWTTAISDAGDVVGATRGPSNYNEWHATLWRAAAGGYQAVDLGLLDGVNTNAMAIAPGLSGENTLVAGQTGDGGFWNQQGFLWRNGVFTRLPQYSEYSRYSTSVRDVADNGMAVGFDAAVGAVLWRDGQLVDLVCPGVDVAYSWANAIALTSSTPRRILIVGHCGNQPVVWYDDGEGGFVAELLPLLTGDTQGIAWDVNASGQIVGESDNLPSTNHAVLWTFTVPGSTNVPPVADAGGDQAVECAGRNGANVALDGSGSHDPDGSIAKYEWFDGDALIASVAQPTVALAKGTHDLKLVVTDNGGGAAEDRVVITVRDARAPDLSLGASPASLWPPNHTYRAITVSASASDVCDPSVTIGGSVVSSEPDEGTGDGHTTGDIRVTRSDGTVLLSSNSAPIVPFNPSLGDRLELRAERKGDGQERTYSIRVSATDASGNASTRTSVVVVPHSGGAP